MKLLGSPNSPYVRKVMTFLREKGIACEFEPVRSADPQVAAANPLSKVPALIRDDGRPLYDSSVIVEYLDVLAKPRLIPETFEERIEMRRWEALGDGIMDATVEISHDNQMPEAQRKGPPYIARQQKKIDNGLATMEKDLGGKTFCFGDTLTLADVCCGNALIYIDRILPDLGWRKTHPNLARLQEKLLARAAFQNG